jgi:predicted SnoaL-like aldol condensation-catalyzing enzyme
MPTSDAVTTIAADQLVAMLEALYNSNDPSLLEALAAPDLRHYSSAIGDGVAAWVAYANRFAGAAPLIAVHRTVSEGNRIGVHAHYRWNPERVIDGGPGVAVAHIFTIEDGRIVEAVELTQAVAIETVSGNDMFAQLRPSVEGQDLDRNRATAERVVTEFLAGGTALRDELLSDYLQHNPFIPDGAEGIAGLIDALGGNPNDYQWSIAEGDLAWTYTRYRSEAMGTGPLVAVDIWRFDEAGKVTEHWDILEPDFSSPDGHAFPR